jgi:tRNA wybutosine-synthesizing protein 1
MLRELVRYVGVLVVAGLTLAYIFKRKFSSQNKEQVDTFPVETKLNQSQVSKRRQRRVAVGRQVSKIKIFFATQAGTAKHFADILASEAEEHGITSELVDVKDCEPEDDLIVEDGVLCVFLLSTFTGGCLPESSAWFSEWLESATTDFRVSKRHLAAMHYAVVAIGNSSYAETFCIAGLNIDKWLRELSALRLLPPATIDENVAKSKHGGLEKDYSFWRRQFWRAVEQGLKPDDAVDKKKHGSCKNSVDGQCGCKDKNTPTSGDDQHHSHSEDGESSCESDDETTAAALSHGELLDVEDLGNMLGLIRTTAANSTKAAELVTEAGDQPREMITPLIRQSLEKQGYKLIGSHSGVKLCRWTKSMLRGRGGCYKHTFYGIESHRCMETTPSLACANKCVFCWRHHTNPVGTEWKWKMDDPQTILDGALSHHVNLIRQFKGVPGVKAERFDEGLMPRHCALSLVGEPIMYPEINKFVDLLHSKQISSFLVTNAQFPDAIRQLVPVTQLYVSVDAATQESLKKIDRPLFRDFWDRFIASLQALADKGQRTVYRLTLVKGYNVSDLQSYADLVAIGKPDFIEVKGVTYCGESKASSLTMDNIPWHAEVVEFVQKLGDLLAGDYAIASEHAHSNCVLLAHKKFCLNGEWWTWIDYDRFHELISLGRPFTASDYMAKTPAWAVFGASEQGFDPTESRFYRKKQRQAVGESSEDGSCDG